MNAAGQRPRANLACPFCGHDLFVRCNGPVCAACGRPRPAGDPTVAAPPAPVNPFAAPTLTGMLPADRFHRVLGTQRGVGAPARAPRLTAAQLTGWALFPCTDKFDRLARALTDVADTGGRYERVLVSETVQLDDGAFRQFADGLLDDRDWLAGKGGNGTVTPADELRDVDSLDEYTPAELDAYRAGAYEIVVEVRGPDAEQRCYVNPEGGAYARRVGFAVSANQATGGLEGRA